MREQEIITFSAFLAEEECGLPRFARNDGCEVTGLPRFPLVVRNHEKRGKARLRVGIRVRFFAGGRKEVGTRVRFLSGGRQGVGTWVKSKKLLFIPSSPMREQEIIIFSVFLAEEECGLPRFARNDGCEVTGLPCFARNDGRRNVDCFSRFGRL